MLVLNRVTTLLSFEVHLVLFHVSVEHIVGAHSQDLRKADEEVEQIDNFDARVLLIKFLVLGPPFPGNAIGEFRDFLRHCPAIIDKPLGFVLIVHAFGPDADTFIQSLLHPKQFTELIWFFHGRKIEQLRAREKIQMGPRMTATANERKWTRIEANGKERLI